MGAAIQPVPPFGLRSAKQALLIIHGIGEQNPYETLDSFARGVFSYLRDTLHLNAKLCPIEIAHKDWTQVGMRIGIFDANRELPECPESSGYAAAKDEPDARVDLFEYYWAPITEDKLSAVETVKWVLFTDLTPLKYFADNLQEMIGAQGMSRASAFGKALKLYARELARVLLLYIPLAVGMGLLLHWLSGTHSWADALKNILAHSLAYLTVPHAGHFAAVFSGCADGVVRAAGTVGAEAASGRGDRDDRRRCLARARLVGGRDVSCGRAGLGPSHRAVTWRGTCWAAFSGTATGSRLRERRSPAWFRTR